MLISFDALSTMSAVFSLENTFAYSTNKQDEGFIRVVKKLTIGNQRFA